MEMGEYCFGQVILEDAVAIGYFRSRDEYAVEMPQRMENGEPVFRLCHTVNDVFKSLKVDWCGAEKYIIIDIEANQN